MAKCELYYCMYYAILPLHVWTHLWDSCRPQFDPCQFCSKLFIKDKRVGKEINAKLNFDARKIIPPELFYSVASSNTLSSFVHVEFGPDKQRQKIMVFCIMRLSVPLTSYLKCI